MVSIVNYGMGNIGSIANMFKKLNVPTQIISTPDEVMKAKKILLPGVGAFDAAMRKIKELNLTESLIYKANQEKIPFLGICLGMQLLTHRSDEGVEKGLSLIDAETLSFKKVLDLNQFKVPHMGWSLCKIVNQQVKLVDGFDMFDEVRFYFVHSYYVKCKNSSNVFMETNYGIDYASAIFQDNIYGAQFRPEKSHKFGMKLFANFSKV